MATERDKHRTEQVNDQQLLVNALTAVASAVFITDANGRIIWVNAAFSRLSGFAPEDLYGSTPAILQSGRHTSAFYADLWQTIREGRVWHGEVVDQRKDGSLYTADEVITPLFDDDGSITHFIAIQHDMTSKAQESEQHRYLAYHDTLTSLPNRAYLMTAHRQAIEGARRSQSMVATLFLDVDGFKPVNDMHGHHIGDQLLKAIANRLRAAIRKEDVLARLGGDEFAILVTDLSDARVVEELAHKIVDNMSRPFVVRGLKLQVGASVGIALYPEHGEDSEALLNCADQAMYEAKRHGGNDFRICPTTNPMIH